MLGGSGNDGRNLVTIYQSMNNSTMKRLEYQMSKAIAQNEVLDVTITPIYKGNELIPVGLTIDAKGNNGFYLNQSILNVPQR